MYNYGAVNARIFSAIAPLRRRDAWTRETSIVGGLVVPFLLLLFIVERSAPTRFDRWLVGEIQAFPWGDFAFVPQLGSDIGGGVFGLYIAPAGAAAAFLALRSWRLLALLVSVFALHLILISPKLFVTAYRPSPVFGVEGDGGLRSFPSGHVQWATSFYGFLAYLLWRIAPDRLRPLVLATYVAVVIGTMLGRISQGRHWPIDTLAGVLAGLVAVRLIIALDTRLRPFPLPAALRRFSRPRPEGVRREA